MSTLDACPGRAFFMLTVCLSLTAAVPTAPAQETTARAVESLEQLVRDASRDSNHQRPTMAQLQAAEELFVRTLRGDESLEQLRELWAAQHFKLDVAVVNEQELWLLREMTTHKFGRGCYVFRTTDAVPIALQAPHSFGDLHTRAITANLFERGRFAAAAFNTVHRKVMDAAHTDACHLNAFTSAFCHVHRKQALVCQLHGFVRKNRITEAGRSSDLIVSNGTRTATFVLQRAVGIFRRQWSDSSVKLFPTEVLELGATTNHQGRLVRQLGLGWFLHLEMCGKFREQLKRDAGQPAELLKAMEEVARLQHSAR